MRDAGPDIQFRLRHSERVRHYCEADSYCDLRLRRRFVATWVTKWYKYHIFLV